MLEEEEAPAEVDEGKEEVVAEDDEEVSVL